jgi:hypothetical protein
VVCNVVRAFWKELIMWMRALSGLAMTAALGSCSVLYVQHYPADHHCGPEIAAPIVDVAATLLFASAAIYRVARPFHCSNPAGGCTPSSLDTDPGASAVIAGGFAGSAVYGFYSCRGRAVASKPPATAVPQPPDTPRRETQHGEAMELMTQAAAAAERGDCATVKLLGVRIYNLDPTVHASTYVTNPAVRICDPAP